MVSKFVSKFLFSKMNFFCFGKLDGDSVAKMILLLFWGAIKKVAHCLNDQSKS